MGGEYNPTTHRYDHHQRTFNTTFPGRDTKLSSAGLIYLHFGKEIIAQHLVATNTIATPCDPISDPRVPVLWEKLYNAFIEALDAHDNGISVYDATALSAAGISKKFSDGGVTLGALVADLSPNWNDPAPSDPVKAQEEEDKRFISASTMMGEAFMRKLTYYAGAWLPARNYVLDAYEERKERFSSGRVMMFPMSVPWKDHLYQLEEEREVGEAEKVWYVLYPEGQREGAKWRIQAVPKSKDSFESRKPLPEAWRGLRDGKLDEMMELGVEGGIFVHASGFIGGSRTLEGVARMAKKASEI